ARGNTAVGILDLHGHLVRPHLARLAVVEVRRGRTRHQLLLERREPVSGRDGVAPGKVVRMADVDERHAEESSTLDVYLTWNRELRLIEALAAVPGEVRVPEHHAPAVVGRVRAECHGVR